MNWYLSQPATWFAVIAPALASLAYLWHVRAQATGRLTAVFWWLTSALSLQLSYWGGDGLHIWPMFFMALPALLLLRQLPSAAGTAVAVFGQVLLVDVVLSLTEFSSFWSMSGMWYQGIGGAGHADSLVVYPAIAAFLVWGLRKMSNRFHLFGGAEKARLDVTY